MAEVLPPSGTLASQADAKSQTITYAYDDLDRLTGKSGTNLSVVYSYDSGANGVGRRTGMTDGAGTASYGIGASRRLIAEPMVGLPHRYTAVHTRRSAPGVAGLPCRRDGRTRRW